MKKEKKANGWNIVSAVVLTLLIIAEVLVMFQVWKLNMLPGLYFGIVLAVIAVITLLLGLMMVQRKSGKWQKKKTGHTRQIIAYILSFLIIAGCMAGFYVVYQLNDTMSAIAGNQTTNILMDIYVLTDDSAESIQDAASYTFGLSEGTDAETNEKAIAAVEEQLGASITTRYYAGATELADALLAGEVNAVIMDSAYVSILESMEAYGDFSARVRLIHDHVVEKVVEKPITSGGILPGFNFGSGSKDETLDPSEDPFLLYISGNDARRPLLADGGSDVNILVVVNPVDKQVLLVNTPRDYYVPNPASGTGAKDKLSHCGLYGIDNCVTAISTLYGHQIDYYARINFSGFKTLVDAIGGVTVISERSFSAGDYYFYEGENHLNGDQALAFARERKNLPGGDNDRGKNQMRLITGMINQLSASNLISNYSEILNSLEGMFATSMPAGDLAKLVRMQLSDMASWDILSFAVTGDNGNDSCYAVGGGYGYVMYPHEHMVSHASDLIQRVLDGEVLTQDDLVVNP